MSVDEARTTDSPTSVHILARPWYSSACLYYVVCMHCMCVVIAYICTTLGVPDKAMEFLNFVQHVRLEREGMEEPTIVHCRYQIKP